MFKEFSWLMWLSFIELMIRRVDNLFDRIWVSLNLLEKMWKNLLKESEICKSSNYDNSHLRIPSRILFVFLVVEQGITKIFLKWSLHLNYKRCVKCITSLKFEKKLLDSFFYKWIGIRERNHANQLFLLLL